MSEEQDNRSNIPLDRTRDNGRPEQQDRGRRASRPEDFESRAPHTLELEETQSEPRPHRNGSNGDDDEPPRPSFRDITQKFLPGESSFPRTPQEEWMTNLRIFGRNSLTITREEHETPNDNLSHHARSDQYMCEN